MLHVIRNSKIDELLTEIDCRQIAVDAANFFMKKFKINTTVIFFQEIYDENEHKNVRGATEKVGNGIKVVARMDFNISNVNTRIASFLETIAHEFVHVQQIDSKRLDYETIDGINYFQWNGEDFPLWEEYINRPWEIEAFRLQNPLTAQFIENYFV